jgi:NodT family efflux transporter outer membrane factor (OMF) lipoprotein
LLGRVRGSLYPQVQTATVGGGAIELSKNSELFSILPGPVADATDDSFESLGVGIDAAWELDLWGRFRRGIEAADANLEGTVATRADVLITVQGEVARVYVLLRTLQEQLANAQANVELQQRSLDIATVRNRNGLTTELDVQQSLALLRDTQSLIPMLTTAIRRIKNVLSLLVGRPPSELVDLVAEQAAIPVAPDSIAVGVPSDLLRRRPDVRSAEMLVASQSALIGATKADMYPAFRLMGSVGYAAESTDDLFESDSLASVGTFGFVWKFLNYGRLQNKVRAQDARFQQAVTGYQLTVLAAAREVEDALVGYLGAKEQVVLKQDSVNAAQRAVEIALAQYRDGQTNYTTVLGTQRIQLLHQDALARTRGRVATNLVAAYKALGGGWTPGTAGEIVPPDIRAAMQERTRWGDLLD